MNSWLGVVFISAVSCIVYFTVGWQFMIAFHKKSSVSVQFLIGYVICLVIFEILNIPFQLFNFRLSSLAVCYVSILAVVLLILFLKNRNENRNNMHFMVRYRFGLKDFLAVVVVGIQIWYVLYNGYYGSLWDSSQYTGTAVAAVYTDTMNRVNPYTGEPMAFNWVNAFYGFEMHSAAICILIKMHALIYINRVVAVFEVMIYNAAAYNIGLELFHKERKKAVFSLVFLALMNFGMNTMYTPAAFFFTRAGEPKSMVVNVGIPVVLLALVKVVKRPEDKGNWMMLTMFSFFSLALAQSGAFLIPVLVTAGVLPIVIRNRKYIYHYLCSMVPSVWFFMIVVLQRG